MYSVQDERLDPLKGKSSSVYIVESDNDFFWCVIQANKQFSQAFQIFFLFLLLLLCRGDVCRYNVGVCVSSCFYHGFIWTAHY